MRRSNWWIWSLIIGLAASGFVAWRVLSQHHEVQRQKIENSLTSMDQAALAGTVSETNPISAQQRALADRLKAALAVPESDTGIHPINRPIFTYWEGWARLTSGLNAINEALGDGNRASDPRPDTYTVAWERIEQAINDLNFDIPTDLSEEDYARFREHTASQWLGVEDAELADALGLAMRESASGRVVTRADEGALAAIGAKLSDKPPETKDLSVVVLGQEVPKLQRDFLATRLGALSRAESASFRLAHRFMEMNLPELAWQHLRIVNEDIPLPGKKLTMRSLVGQALAARKRQITTMAEMLDDPLNTNLIDRLNQERTVYQTAVERFRREALYSAPFAADLLKPHPKTGLSKYDDMQADSLRRLEVLHKEMATLEDYDPEFELERTTGETGDPDRAKALVDRKSANIDREKHYLLHNRRVALERVAVALDAVREFPVRVSRMGGVAGGEYDGSTLGDFTDDDLKRLLNGPGPFGAMYQSVTRQEQPGFASALRRLLLAELSVIRADASLLMGEGFESKAGLGQVMEDVSLVRELALRAYPSVTERTGKRLAGVPDQAPDEKLRANLMFLTELASEFVSRARAPVGPTQAERSQFNAVADELAALRKTLIRAGFSHAEFSHQQVIGHLRELTGENRPTVTWQAADKARLAWRLWERGVLQHMAGERDEAPRHPMETLDFTSTAEMRELKRWMDGEIRYRELRDTAISEYTSFLDSDSAEIARRAEIGIALLKVEDVSFQYGWKWQNGNDTSIGAEAAGLRSAPYGLFSYVESAPATIAGTPTALAHPRAGSWLGYQETTDYYRRGPNSRTVAEIEALLAKLRDGTAAADQDIFVATRWLSGRMVEFVPSIRNRGQLGAQHYHLGNLPGALLTYYIPLLNGPNGASDESVVRNRYIPLEGEFQRILAKLTAMINATDTSDPASLTELFQSLAPMNDGRTPDESQISDFWGSFFAGMAKRAPGMLSTNDALYEFNYRLARLADRRADLLLASARVESRDIKAQARQARDRARALYRAAGKVLFDHLTRFPDSPESARYNFRIGDAYFESGDYVFAINAYRNYYNDRILADRRVELAEPYYVVNRIGEAYMMLGMHEGKAARDARASGDPDKVALQEDPETMAIDAAIPAFDWNIKRVRRLMLEIGEGGAPRGSLPPAGALTSFVNMARAKIEAGRLRAARGDSEGAALLQEAIDLLRTDLIDSRLFPQAVPGFRDSIYYRDAQFNIGQAELELARAHRALPADQRDTAVFHGHLRRAAEAYQSILENWPQPLNRAVMARASNTGKSVSDAIQEVGSGIERFSDDIYYLTILGRAETDWLKAVHHPDPLSAEVIESLRSADSRLAALMMELDAIHGKDSPVEGTTFGFPDLSRRARFLSADVIYLQARTQRDRIAGGGSTQFAVMALYDRAIAAYQSARALHPHVYEALWAYAQELNCRRALSVWRPDQEREARRMLEAADTFMDALPNVAFDNAPKDMTREAFAEYFQWYDVLAKN